ncbi:LuxR C-terminal-related transcriptional regulator [Streptomyces sp. NPDC093261]|uniref:LuxR C-terminal-related transcriptional regulator n=1 Tax=Streptomyces sp. NPDC093261 TaxID=3366037 RepID=UPI00381F6869
MTVQTLIPAPRKIEPARPTERQLTILTQLALGHGNIKAGRAAGVSADTVKRDIQRMYAATGIRTRPGLVGWAYRAGLVPRLYADRAPVTLPRRRAQILDLVARGKHNRAIARELYLTPDTVRTHINLLFKDLDAHSQAQAVALGYEFGLLGDVKPEARAC